MSHGETASAQCEAPDAVQTQAETDKAGINARVQICRDQLKAWFWKLNVDPDARVATVNAIASRVNTFSDWLYRGVDAQAWLASKVSIAQAGLDTAKGNRDAIARGALDAFLQKNPNALQGGLTREEALKALIQDTSGWRWLSTGSPYWSLVGEIWREPGFSDKINTANRAIQEQDYALLTARSALDRQWGEKRLGYWLSAMAELATFCGDHTDLARAVKENREWGEWARDLYTWREQRGGWCLDIANPSQRGMLVSGIQHALEVWEERGIWNTSMALSGLSHTPDTSPQSPSIVADSRTQVPSTPGTVDAGMRVATGEYVDGALGSITHGGGDRTQEADHANAMRVIGAINPYAAGVINQRYAAMDPRGDYLTNLARTGGR